MDRQPASPWVASAEASPLDDEPASAGYPRVDAHPDDAQRVAHQVRVGCSEGRARVQTRMSPVAPVRNSTFSLGIYLPIYLSIYLKLFSCACP